MSFCCCPKIAKFVFQHKQCRWHNIKKENVVRDENDNNHGQCAHCLVLWIYYDLRSKINWCQWNITQYIKYCLLPRVYSSFLSPFYRKSCVWKIDVICLHQFGTVCNLFFVYHRKQARVFMYVFSCHTHPHTKRINKLASNYSFIGMKWQHTYTHTHSSKTECNLLWKCEETQFSERWAAKVTYQIAVVAI